MNLIKKNKQNYKKKKKIVFFLSFFSISLSCSLLCRISTNIDVYFCGMFPNIVGNCFTTFKAIRVLCSKSFLFVLGECVCHWAE